MTQHSSRLNESFVAAPKLLGELYTDRVTAEKWTWTEKIAISSSDRYSPNFSIWYMKIL